MYSVHVTASTGPLQLGHYVLRECKQPQGRCIVREKRRGALC